MNNLLASFDVAIFVDALIKLVLALLLALPIAYNREQETRIMGVRTFPLVAAASCAYVLIVRSFIPEDADDAQTRVIQGLLAGIGFIGGGAILKDEKQVRGTATAASIWATGAIGAGVAYNRFEIAILLALLTYLVLRFLTGFKVKVNSDDAEV